MLVCAYDSIPLKNCSVEGTKLLYNNCKYNVKVGNSLIPANPKTVTEKPFDINAIQNSGIKYVFSELFYFSPRRNTLEKCDRNGLLEKNSRAIQAGKDQKENNVNNVCDK